MVHRHWRGDNKIFSANGLCGLQRQGMKDAFNELNGKSGNTNVPILGEL